MSLSLVCQHDLSFSFLRKAIDIPFRDGASLIRYGLGIPTLNERMIQQLTDHSYPLAKPGFVTRTAALLTGVLLFVPILNIVLDYLVRKIVDRLPPANTSDKAVEQINSRLPTEGTHTAQQFFFDESEVSKSLKRSLRLAREQMHAELPPNPDFDETVEEVLFPEMEDVHSMIVGGLNVGVAQKNGLRPTLEDRYLATEVTFDTLDPNYKTEKVAKLFAVFDGHGGAEAVNFASSRLPHYLSRNLTRLFKVGVTDGSIQQALRTTFQELDRDYGGNAGTTACVALLIDNKLFVANVGDSRAIISLRKHSYLQRYWKSWPQIASFLGLGFLFRKTVQLSKDQKADDPEMIRGVVKRGGIISKADKEPAKVNGMLALPRAIGDWDIRGINGEKCISPLPKITKINNPTGLLLLGTKGFWHTVTTEQAGDILDTFDKHHLRCHIAAAKLAQAAQKSGSDDNITVMMAAI